MTNKSMHKHMVAFFTFLAVSEGPVLFKQVQQTDYTNFHTRRLHLTTGHPQKITSYAS